MSKITLSIVIPTYNSESYLIDCLKSVEKEAQAGVEFILVDGASSDATMEIVERYRHLFSHIISERDRGQSDAFNKGFALAKGKFLTWLNSDDVLFPGAMAVALPALEGSKKDWLVANSVYLDEKGCLTRCCRSGGFEHFAVKRGQLSVFGPSTFFSKKLFQELGGIDESYHFCMDTEYWWRIVAAGRTYERMKTYFWGLRLHSEAKTASVLLTGQYPPGMREESQKIASCYFPEVTPKQRLFATRLSRIWRVLNLSYVQALLDTLLKRGKRLI
jgi:glycosyltransferase involved in cell wall biosynthesis